MNRCQLTPPPIYPSSQKLQSARFLRHRALLCDIVLRRHAKRSGYFPRDTTELHSARRFATLLLAQPRVIALSDADSTTLTLLSRWRWYYAIRPGIAPNVLEFYIIMPNKRSRTESSRSQAAGQWTGSGLFKPNPELEPQLARQRRVAKNRAKARLRRGLGSCHSECWLNRHGSDGVSARRTRRVPLVRLTTGGDRH
jgi:hypothetical protein